MIFTLSARSEVTDPPRCLCCGAGLEGAYCAACGQVASTRRLGVRELASRVMEGLSDLDGTWPRTLVGLIKNPGRVCSEYVDGRRVIYVNPFKYALVMLALYLLGYRLLDLDRALGASALDPSIPPRIAARVVAAQGFIVSNLSAITFLSLPPYALALTGLFRRSGRNFAESYAFVLFVSGQSSLYGLVLLPLSLSWPTVAFWLTMAVALAFTSWCARGFFREPRRLTLGLKVLAASLIYLGAILTWSMLVFAVAMLLMPT